MTDLERDVILEAAFRLAEEDAEVPVEIAGAGGRPIKIPAHAFLERLQLAQWRARRRPALCGVT